VRQRDLGDRLNLRSGASSPAGLASAILLKDREARLFCTPNTPLWVQLLPVTHQLLKARNIGLVPALRNFFVINVGKAQ